ncbi:MAG TPA: phage holin family protein [Chthoniobacteraceae bacterium]|jgi:uncharacterized membrane protein YqjE|nr:phage holin family protein [Chthoniobacteraceae bacterium]
MAFAAGTEQAVGAGVAEPDVWSRAAAWFGSLLAYIQARGHLAALEGKEAAINVGLAVTFGVVALVCVLIGYVLLMFAIAFLIAWISGGGNAWIWATIGIAVLHLGGAGFLVSMARKRAGGSVFAATMDEFRKDQEWLKS